MFSYASSGINAHAAWNIDWGDEPDGMQTGRGHRMATMSVDGDYTNVGIAAIHETNSGTSVGEYVTTANYCQANSVYSNHYNIFIVGTVWTDANGNDQYDPGEGKGNVAVIPNQGGYYAVTGSAGGYAIPVSNGTNSVSFNGGELTGAYTKTVTVSGKSALLDINTSSANQYSLTISKSGTGSGTVTSTPAGINCGTDCSENYDDGTIISLTASPSSGSIFIGWAGDCSGTGTCQVTMDAAKSMVATFDITPSYSFPWNLFLPSIINSTQ